MAQTEELMLEPGRAYRTRDLRRWSANPTRFAKRLVEEGRLREAAHGLYYVPVETRFGLAPASDRELLRAFLDGDAFLITGPPIWNALNLGSTAMFAVTLVYNTKRTGEFLLDGRRYLLRRVGFPPQPPVEWFIIDLLQHHDMAGAPLSELRQGLTASLRQGSWDVKKLREMADTYGTRAIVDLVTECIEESKNKP